MKKIAIIIFLLANMNLFAQTTYVPDDNFEQALIDLGYDDVLDNYVLTENINGIASLNVNNKSITDLTGIEDFVALTELYCQVNQLTSLDISANSSLTILSCSSNQLTNLDVSTNNALTELWSSTNQLTSLDVSANSSLTLLTCSSNQLTNLDVSTNTALTFLACEYNQLKNLDVRNGNNANFIFFNAISNSDLTCIYVDDATWSTTNWTGIDASSTFVETEAECDALDVKVISDNGLIIYPNPTKETFSINTDNKIESIKVYDVFGKIIFEKTAVNQYDMIDLSHCKKGIYIIRVQTDKNIITSKIVKN